MQKNQTLIDDLMSLSGNVLGNLLGARHEMKAQAKERMNQIAKHLNFVSRDEFDGAFAMLAKARTMQEELSERLQAIEAKLGLFPKHGKTYASPKAGIQHPVSSKSGMKTQTKHRLPSFRKSNKSRKRS
jgi:BMFP domain-containing protein YqiC